MYQTIEHTRYPDAKELRRIREEIEEGALYPVEYIMSAARLQHCVDSGGRIALAENAFLLKWPEDSDGGGVMVKLTGFPEEDNYLIDTAYPALI